MSVIFNLSYETIEKNCGGGTDCRNARPAFAAARGKCGGIEARKPRRPCAAASNKAAQLGLLQRNG